MFIHAAANLSSRASAAPAPSKAQAAPAQDHHKGPGVTVSHIQSTRSNNDRNFKDPVQGLIWGKNQERAETPANRGSVLLPTMSVQTVQSQKSIQSQSSYKQRRSDKGEGPHANRFNDDAGGSFTELLSRVRSLLDSVAAEHALEITKRDAENRRLRGILTAARRVKLTDVYTDVPALAPAIDVEGAASQEVSAGAWPSAHPASQPALRPGLLQENRNEYAPALAETEEDLEVETHGVGPVLSVAKSATERSVGSTLGLNNNANENSPQDRRDGSLKEERNSLHSDRTCEVGDYGTSERPKPESENVVDNFIENMPRRSVRKNTRMSMESAICGSESMTSQALRGNSRSENRQSLRGTASTKVEGMGFNRESLVQAFNNVNLRKSLSFAADVSAEREAGGESITSGDIGGAQSVVLSQAYQLFPLRDIWVMKEDQVLRSQSMRKSIQRSLTKIPAPGSRTARESIKSQGSIKRLMRSQVMLKITSLTSQELRDDGSKCIINPQSSTRFCWDVLGIILIGYDIVTIPLQLFALGESTWDIVMSWIASLYWTLDVIWSFRTGVYVGGMLEMRAAQIAKRYLRTWFAIDMVIVLPEWFSLVSGSGSGLADSMKGLRGLRALRFLRLLRLVKVERIIKDLEARINSNYFLLTIGIAKLISGLCMVNHLFASLWYGIGRVENDGWVYHTGLEEGADFSYKYLTSMHWSLTQFHGTMEIYPRNLPERAFSVAVVLIALILFSSFLSSITNLMIQLQSLRSESVRQNRVLRTYLQQHQISQSLSVRVKKFVVGRTLLRQERDDEVELLRLLPENLLMDVHEETRAPALAYHVLFCDFRAVHRRASRQLYHNVLVELPVLGGETIFSDGDVCGRMLFVESGFYRYKCLTDRGSGLSLDPFTVQSMTTYGSRASSMSSTDITYGRDRSITSNTRGSMSSRLVSVSKGEWVSEAVLWTPNWENTGELKCSADGNLLALPAQEFGEMIATYPGAHLEVAMYARAFIQTLHETDDPSDLTQPPTGWNIGNVEPEAIMRNVSYPNLDHLDSDSEAESAESSSGFAESASRNSNQKEEN